MDTDVDLKNRIAELERYNLSLATEAHELKERIFKLEGALTSITDNFALDTHHYRRAVKALDAKEANT